MDRTARAGVLSCAECVAGVRARTASALVVTGAIDVRYLVLDASTSPTEWGVRVPCSTSNLGPGFDLLGLALDRFVTIRARLPAERTDGMRTSYSGHTPPDTAGPDSVARTFAAFDRAFGCKLPALDVEVASEIPIGRGFGSSGAVVAAALLVAAEVSGRADLARDRERALVPLACELEGHPDNSTASLLGGCTLGCPLEDGRLAVVRQPVHRSIGFALAWPDEPLSTAESRQALPADVSFDDARENPRRLALLLEGLRTGAPGLLAAGVADRLHERFRRPLVEGADEACARAVEAGAYAACLSGAGSGLVALGPVGSMEGVAAALAAPLDGGRSAVVRPVLDPPDVRAYAV